MRRIVPDLPAVEWTDPSGQVVLIERESPQGLIGKRVGELEIAGARVVSVRRLGSATMPGPDTVVQEGDVWYIVVPVGAVGELDTALAAAGTSK